MLGLAAIGMLVTGTSIKVRLGELTWNCPDAGRGELTWTFSDAGIGELIWSGPDVGIGEAGLRWDFSDIESGLGELMWNCSGMHDEGELRRNCVGTEAEEKEREWEPAL